MPVPISVTNPGGVGLAAHSLSSLETLGPFARLKAEAVDPSHAILAENNPPSSTSGASQKHGDFEPQAHQPDAATVVLTDLSFAYPGLGKRCRMGSMHLSMSHSRPSLTQTCMD